MAGHETSQQDTGCGANLDSTDPDIADQIADLAGLQILARMTTGHKLAQLDDFVLCARF